MSAMLPDPKSRFPIILPDGTPHAGTVFLREVLDHPRIEVGAFSYASDFDPPAPEGWAERLAPYLFEFSQDRLVIGKFCQIAHGVRFIGASANHEMRAISSFPFAVFDPDTMAGYQPDTRDTYVGHDVWLGYGALVMAGARIGNGVIIGAGSVVRGAVPDYAVMTGNPAKVVRMRFDAAEIARLNALAWWDWPAHQIATARDLIESGDVTALETFAATRQRAD